MSPLAVLGAVVGAIGLALTLAAVLVSLGRVLQRQDHVEAAAKVTAATVDALKETLHAQERELQATAARIDGQAGEHARASEKLSELRTQFHEAIRSLTSLREDIVGRLARIESYVEHHSTPPPLPGSGFGPPRHPTQPR